MSERVAVNGCCENCGEVSHLGGEGYCECECHIGVELAAELRAARAALHHIAQYDPRFKGQHVNDAPSRKELIERAYDAWWRA